MPMETRAPATAYSTTAKLLHWNVALLVLLVLPVGVSLDKLPEGRVQDMLYDLHRSCGMLVLVLALWSLLLRCRRTPAPLPTLTPFERVASRLAHWGLAVLVVAMPLIGWAGMSEYGGNWRVFGLFQPPGFLPVNKPQSDVIFAVHAYVGYALATLIAIHVCAALLHWRVKRDGVMSRMLFRRRG